MRVDNSVDRKVGKLVYSKVDLMVGPKELLMARMMVGSTVGKRVVKRAVLSVGTRVDSSAVVTAVE